jgi:hypothetical protein
MPSASQGHTHTHYPNNGICSRHTNVNGNTWGECYSNPKNKKNHSGNGNSTKGAPSFASAASKADLDNGEMGGFTMTTPSAPKSTCGAGLQQKNLRQIASAKHHLIF